MEYRPWICSCSFASCHSILTSGIILITAGYIIGQKCSVFYIADIGALFARDASIAVPLVLILLPALLALGDKWIIDRRLKGYDLYPESVPEGRYRTAPDRRAGKNGLKQTIRFGGKGKSEFSKKINFAIE